MLLVQPLHKTLDGRLLIVAVCNLVVDGQVGDVRPCSLLHDVFQIIMAMERDNLSVRIAKPIYHFCHIPICEIDDWSHPILLLQTIRILYCLFASFHRTLYCALCFNYCQRLTAFAEQYIVSIAGSRRADCRVHSFYLHLYAGFAALHVALDTENVPSCFIQHVVYEALASDGFAL